MNLDLSELDALKSSQDQGADLVVEHPVSREPLGLVLRIAGADSDAIKKVQRRHANERLRSRAKNVTAEELERNAREIVAASVLDWRFENGLTIDGAVPDCTKDEVDKLLRRFPWVQGQIDEFASDRANFLPS